jgi:hypothetical protein
VNQIAKAAGAGLDPGKVARAIQNVKVTLKDLSPAHAAKVEQLTDTLNRNPNAVAKVSSILEPIIKLNIDKKLREFGIMGGSGMCGGASFAHALKQEIHS